FRCGPLLSAGTPSASLPWQRVCRRCSQRPALGDPPQGTAGSPDTCCSRKWFRWREHLRAGPGVNGPPLQTTTIIVQSIYTVLLPNNMLAKEIYEDSLKKKTAFSACDVSQRSFPSPAGKRRRGDPTASEGTA